MIIVGIVNVDLNQISTKGTPLFNTKSERVAAAGAIIFAADRGLSGVAVPFELKSRLAAEVALAEMSTSIVADSEAGINCRTASMALRIRSTLRVVSSI